MTPGAPVSAEGHLSVILVDDVNIRRDSYDASTSSDAKA